MGILLQKILMDAEEEGKVWRECRLLHSIIWYFQMKTVSFVSMLYNHINVTFEKLLFQFWSSNESLKILFLNSWKYGSLVALYIHFGKLIILSPKVN